MIKNEEGYLHAYKSVPEAAPGSADTWLSTKADIPLHHLTEKTCLFRQTGPSHLNGVEPYAFFAVTDPEERRKRCDDHNEFTHDLTGQEIK